MHTSVECAPAVVQRLREWAKARSNVTVVEGTWQSCLPNLGSFDRIFFDASKDLDSNVQEMERCPETQHRNLYLQALRRSGPKVFDAFEAAVAAEHCNLGAKVLSADGSEFREWSDGFFFSLDRDGKEQLLDADGAQVMMEWERSYMEECVTELAIDETCDVLEVGFGCGYSASCIQQMRPRTHTIIECAEAVLERLHVWAADKPNVRVVEGTWQARLPELEVFDCIFIDDYGIPGLADREMERCPRPEYREEYEETFEHEGGSHFEAFVRIALAWHARKGTRLSGFVMRVVPDLGDADVESQYRYVEVAPPGHCNYFFSRRAIVPLFMKRSSAAADADLGGSSTRSSSSGCGSSRSRSRSRSRRPPAILTCSAEQ